MESDAVSGSQMSSVQTAKENLPLMVTEPALAAEYGTRMTPRFGVMLMVRTTGCE